MYNEVAEFRNSFSEEQKVAVMHCLLIVAQCDQELHHRELELLNQTARTLGIHFDPANLSPLMKRMFQQNNFPILNTLNRSQKEWYICAMHSIMHADGKVLEKEVLYCLSIAEEIGIDSAQYKSILDKMDVLYKLFMK
jgi:uncharacterized tellurite resistance protein B-like protein